MTTPFNRKPLVAVISAILMAGMTTGCVEEESLNTNSVTYEPEERELGVLTSDDVEQKPGTIVSISGRLVGTVTNQTLLWVQIEGDPIEIADPTASNLTFTAPSSVLGSQAYVFELRAIDADGNQAVDANGDALIDQVKVTIFDPDSVITLEAEDATLTNDLAIAVQGDDVGHYVQGASGDQHTNDLLPGQRVVWDVDLEQAGYYTLFVNFTIGAGYGEKSVGTEVNGLFSEIKFTETGGWIRARFGVYNLDEGINEIKVGGGWDYYRVDSIELIPAAAPAAPLPTPTNVVNANATNNTNDLMEFLTSHYGTATLSGQAELPTSDGSTNGLVDFAKVTSATNDDAPAIVEFDLMEYSSSRIAKGNKPGTLVEDVIGHHQSENIIVGLAWHWNAPMHLKDGSGDQAWHRGFYTEATDFDLAAALADKDSAEYAALLSDIDDIAVELAKLANEDIPVLWRPLHEAEGTWFWWGAAGAEAFKELWSIMYDRLTNHHALNNLIWVYTGASDLSADWYPGHDVVDIVGYDGYDGVNDDNTFLAQYNLLKNRYNGKKMVALTETGAVPNVELMHSANAWWGYFVTWYSRDWNQYGPANMDAATIDTNYAFDGVVNLLDVPGGDRIGAGIYQSFEFPVNQWDAQIEWGNVAGGVIASNWKTSGSYSFGLNANLVQFTQDTGKTPYNVTLQTYPANDIDISGKNFVALRANYHAKDAGTDVAAHLFFKYFAPDGSVLQVWPNGVALVNGEGSMELRLDDLLDANNNPITTNMLDGLGVHFTGFDANATAAQFNIDSVVAIDADGKEHILYDFEITQPKWESQINWGNFANYLSSDWKASGAHSFALASPLPASEINDISLQYYPSFDEEKIEVKDFVALRADVYANNVADGVKAHLFYKWNSGNSQHWPNDANSTAITVGQSNTLEISLLKDHDDKDIELTSINGLGVHYYTVNDDNSGNKPEFMIDRVVGVRADGSEQIMFDLDGLPTWDFQVNWSNRSGKHFASDWSNDGVRSFGGKVQLTTTDLAVDYPSVVIQTYPEGGMKLGAVTKLKLTAYAKDAGANATAKLWIKDKDWGWANADPVVITEGGVELEIDISNVGGELKGFGVQFEGLDNSTTESNYYIDNVRFE